MNECVNIVIRFFQGQFLAIFSSRRGDAAGKWYSAGDDLSVYQGKDSLFVARIMVWYKDELAQGLQNGNWTGADRVLEMIRTYQAKNKVIPMDEQKIKAEILYNQADVFSWCRSFISFWEVSCWDFVFAWMMNEKRIENRLPGFDLWNRNRVYMPYVRIGITLVYCRLCSLDKFI